MTHEDLKNKYPLVWAKAETLIEKGFSVFINSNREDGGKFVDICLDYVLPTYKFCNYNTVYYGVKSNTHRPSCAARPFGKYQFGSVEEFEAFLIGKDKVTPQFKIGDTVKIKNLPSYKLSVPTRYNGKVGTIIDINDISIFVSFSKVSLYCSPDEVELVTTKGQLTKAKSAETRASKKVNESKYILYSTFEQYVEAWKQGLDKVQSAELDVARVESVVKELKKELAVFQEILATLSA